jgi:nitrogen fixation protein FixH
MNRATGGQFTGRHMAAIFVAFFGVVIAVNVIMARYAVATFGGEVVANSYVASQNFNRWLGEASAEKALGWQVATSRQPDGRLALTLTGAPRGASLTAMARHPVGRLPDRMVSFTSDGAGHFVSTQPLPQGRWQLHVEARAGGHIWRREELVQ